MCSSNQFYILRPVQKVIRSLNNVVSVAFLHLLTRLCSRPYHLFCFFREIFRRDQQSLPINHGFVILKFDIKSILYYSAEFAFEKNMIMLGV